MRNRIISAGTARDIDQQVEKVLKGLGNPEPPLRLEDVEELLKLDRKFYTGTDDGFLQETISRIKVGTLQILQRPGLLADSIRKLNLKALYVPDRKRILIDSELPTPKVRWVAAHEITHELCMDWHGDVLFGDSELTLSESCHEQIEHEANYGAGRLLTLQDRFLHDVRSQIPSLASIKALGKRYGNTWTSTLWRSVEAMHFPAFAVVGGHPHHKVEGERIRYFIQSPSFSEQFGTITEAQVLSAMRGYCKWTKIGPLGESDTVVFANSRGEEFNFEMETFGTRYDTLTLGHLLGPKAPSIAT